MERSKKIEGLIIASLKFHEYVQGNVTEAKNYQLLGLHVNLLHSCTFWPLRRRGWRRNISQKLMD